MHRFRLVPSALPPGPPARLCNTADRGGWATAVLVLVALVLAEAGGVLPQAARRGGQEALIVPQQAPDRAVHRPRIAAAAAAPPAVPVDEQVAALGRQPPRGRDPIRARYLKTPNLYTLLQDLLPDAAAGERASQYYVYLILGQCQTWLRMDAESALALNERVMLAMNDRPAGERLQWQSEYQRCREFAGGDLEPLRMAMGAETPGSEVEYASIWFQRSAAAGYPPALAEAALRINLLSVAERRALLEEAVQSADADVFWQLFLNSPGDGADPVSPAGMAWLDLVRRAGHDCTGDAEWFRGAVCQQEGAGCTPGESAVEHYWYSLTDADRAHAHLLAGRMKAAILAGHLDRLPWPALANRNIYENRFAQAGADRLTDSIR